MSLLGALRRGARRRGLTSITGPVLRPADPGYAAEIAAFNTAVHRRPGIVVGAESEDDVVAAVAGAAADGLPGRLVVLGVREADVTAVSSSTVTRFLTVAWSR